MLVKRSLFPRMVCSYRTPTRAQHGSFVLKESLALTVPRAVNLIDPDLLVPACDREIIGFGAEAKARDAVVGRVADSHILA